MHKNDEPKHNIIVTQLQYNDVLLTGVPQDVHPMMFTGIDEEMIRKAAIKTKGGSGPSAMDADGWRRILMFKQLWRYKRRSQKSDS